MNLKDYQRQTQGSMLLVFGLSGAFGLVAFLALMVIGGFSFSPALFLALLVAVVVFVVLLRGFHSKPEEGATGGTAATAKSSASTSAPAAKPAAKAPDPTATAAAAEKKADSPPPAAAPAAAAAEGTPADAGQKPALMKAPREGGADDLKQIKGVGPKLEQLLNSMGIYHFDQISNWTAAEIAWVDDNLEGFKGRVSRDDWVSQAKTLAAGGQTDFSDKVKKGDVY